MDDSTCQIIDEDQSIVQDVQTQETPTHDVHDVIESDEHDLSGFSNNASPYVDSESDNECRRPKPNGRKYWFPDIPIEEKPNEGDVFDNFDEAYNMYLEYSQKARFSIRKSTTKRKNGSKSFMANCYKLYDFVENHNHPLVEENNLDNLKARRKLDFSDKVFIHRASLSNIGPTKAHRLRVAFMGGYHKTVNGELSRLFWADEKQQKIRNDNYIALSK
ncbi:hypothetical protein Tco_1194235 [Tanacetum coccineum]